MQDFCNSYGRYILLTDVFLSSKHAHLILRGISWLLYRAIIL